MSTIRTAGTYINPQTFLTGAKFQTTDGATSTSADSPASAASAGADLTLSCPDYAAELVLVTDFDAKISEDSSFTGYDLLQASTRIRFGVGNMDKVYIRGDSGNVWVFYHWVMV